MGRMNTLPAINHQILIEQKALGLFELLSAPEGLINEYPLNPPKNQYFLHSQANLQPQAPK